MAFVQDFFTAFGAARWTNPNGTVFPVAASMANETYERRLVARKRPYVDGAPLDDTGSDPDVFSVTILFANGHGNPGVPDPAYPAYHRRFMTEGRIKGTGTLYYPGLGNIRCRMKSCSSALTPGERDSETVQATFWQDLEDLRATADSFTQPSAKTAGPMFVRQLTNASAPHGLGGLSLGSIARTMTQLQAAANSPFDSAAQIDRTVSLIVQAGARAEATLTNGPRYFGAGAASPAATAEAAVALSLLRRTIDATIGQRAAAFGTGSVTVRSFPRDLSLADVAVILAQPYADLARLNARQASFVRIPRGTPIFVRV